MRPIVIVILLLAGYHSYSQSKTHAIDNNERMTWFRNARLGIFIHWGVYSVLAGEYNGQVGKGSSEWIMENAGIPIAEYENYAKQFNPQSFNPTQWVELIKQSGAKYVVITAKHHDGFCLWDSKLTDYDIAGFSPYRRDLLADFSKACKTAGIKLGIYYSILDWHHPHAQAKVSSPKDWNMYREQYMKLQLAELITNCDPDLLWFDGEWINEWTEEQGKALYSYVRELKPSIITNNRVGKARMGMSGINQYENAAGDYQTPEQEIPVNVKDEWEACMTMNDSWGFKYADNNWKPSKVLIQNIIDVTVKGGNYLLNVGPKASGEFPSESIYRLREIGSWMKINGEAVYTTSPFEISAEKSEEKFTISNDKKWLYAFCNPKSTVFTIANLQLRKGVKPLLLINKKPVEFKESKKGIEFSIPPTLKTDYPLVIKIPVQF